MIKIYNFNNIPIVSRNTIKRIVELIVNEENNVIVSVSIDRDIVQKIRDFQSNDEYIDYVRNFFLSISNLDNKVVQDIKEMMHQLKSLLEKQFKSHELESILSETLVQVINYELTELELLSPHVYGNEEDTRQIFESLCTGTELFYEYDILVLKSNDLNRFATLGKENISIGRNLLVINSVDIWRENQIKLDEKPYSNICKQIYSTSLYFPNHDRLLIYNNVISKPLKHFTEKKYKFGNNFW